jgi:hypothetical protein
LLRVGEPGEVGRIRYAIGDAPHGFAELCKGTYRERTTGSATLAFRSKFPNASIQREVLRVASEALKADSSITTGAEPDPDLVFTLGAGRDDGDDAVVPFTVWYRRR